MGSKSQVTGPHGRVRGKRVMSVFSYSARIGLGDAEFNLVRGLSARLHVF